MSNRLISFFVLPFLWFLVGTPILLAQVGVDGTWEGVLVIERPTPVKEYKFELVLKRQGNKVVGTSYIYYDEQPPVAMNLSGRYFYDRSMRLFNQEVIFPSDAPNKERHIRKYQLMYKRSAFTPDTIEGYWQEKNDPIFAKYRKGKVYLTRKKVIRKHKATMEKLVNKETLKILSQLSAGQQILLYDGVCNLCNGFVQFVLKRDKEEKFLFAALQSKIGEQLLQHFQLSTQLETVVLIDKNTAYTQSDVSLKVGQALGGWMKIAFIGWLLPKSIRDVIYDFIAVNRYRLFGKKEQCMLPKPEWKRRFLDM